MNSHNKLLMGVAALVLIIGITYPNSKAAAQSVPAQPKNLIAAALSDTEINLIWDRTESTTSSLDETSITVWRSTNSGPYVSLAVLPAGSNIFTDTSCYPATTYSYQVTADNAQGNSAPSNIISATTTVSKATVPAATNVTASAASPFIINLSWTDNQGNYEAWSLERSTDGISYKIVKVIQGAASAGGTVSYSDIALSSSTTYYYRARINSGSGYSNYNSPVSATTAALGNLPLVPTGLTTTVTSATSATLNWTDTNNGTASYLIETAGNPWDGENQTWTQIAQTAIGATSYNMTTTAQTFYMIRIRASDSHGDSGYTQYIDLRTASAGTGSPKVYNIGPGKAYTSLGAFNWANLGPGDIVNIYPNRDSSGNIIPYYEGVVINARGTATQPITITGIPDPTTGALPIIDGTNAVITENMPVNSALQSLFLIMIGADAHGYTPGYLTLSNLEIRNAYDYENDTIPTGGSNTYTLNGTTGTYKEPSCIYLTDGDHITIKGNIIHGCNDGVFGAGSGDPRNLEEVTLDSNYIYYNGTISNALTHSTYLEGLNTVYQFNRYGVNRPGAGDLGDLKDRGAGTVVRYNFLQGGGHLIDLVETQNYYATVFLQPSYHQTYVYGNVFYNDLSGATTPVYYGGDQGVTMAYRKGILHFYDNTFINYMSQREPYYSVTIFDMASSGESIDVKNNIMYFQTANSSDPIPDMYLVSYGGAYFGRNWVTNNYTMHVANSSYYTYVGNNNGTTNFITNTTNNPGFISFASLDFDLSSSSQVINQSVALSTDELPPLAEYVVPFSGTQPICLSAAPDLGAFQSDSETSCPTGTVGTPTVPTIPPTGSPTVSLSAVNGTTPGSVVLTATASENNGTIANVVFDENSAPIAGTVINTPPIYIMTLTNLTQGATYSFTATATDASGVSITSAPVTVTVAAAPVAPVVSAGSAQTITLPSTVSLTGTATDITPGTLTTLWAAVSGPGTVTFANAAALNTTATFSVAGTYILKLTATNTATSQSSSATVTITVNAASVPLIVNAGSAQTITLPSTAALNGSVTGALPAAVKITTASLTTAKANSAVALTGLATTKAVDLPTGTVTTLWTATGPGTVTFANAAALSTIATFSIAGTYTLTLTATDAATSQTGSGTVTITVNPIPTYVLTVTPPANGTVSQSVNGVSSSGPYHPGTIVTLTATAAIGYHFGSWSGAVSGSTNPVTVTMNANESVTANFSIQTETITVNAGMGGIISPSGTVSVNYGANQTFTLTPADGYQVNQVLVDGKVVSVTNNAFTLSDVTIAHSISVSFTKTATPPPTVTTTAPQAPTNLTASVRAGQINLSWTASTGATSYTVQRLSNWSVGYVTIATGVTASKYTDKSITNATEYYYEVIAVNAKGKSYPSNQVTAVATTSGNYTFPVYVYGAGKVQYSYLSSGKTVTADMASGSSITVPAGTKMTMTSTPATGYTFYQYFIPFSNVDYSVKSTEAFTVTSNSYVDVRFQKSIT